MSVVDSVGQSFSSVAWGGLGQALFIFIIFFVILILFGVVSLFSWWKSYGFKVTIFEPLGQMKFTDEELKQIQQDVMNGILSDKLRQIKFDSIKKRVTHGKDLTVKGTAYFGLFIPLKRIKPIPLLFRYSDGIFLLRLSRDVFIPIPRPSFVINVGQNVAISVAEQQEWVSWSNMMADRINAKYQNPDATQKQALYFVVGIVALVVIGGFILWLIYSSAKKGLEVKDLANNIITAVKQQAPIMPAPK